MALSGNDIRNMIQQSDNIDDFSERLAAAINENLHVEIPAGQVIISVSGGSGAPAVGTPNPAPIVCNIIPG